MTSRNPAVVTVLALLAFSNAGLAASNRMHELMAEARAEGLAHPARVVTSRQEMPAFEPGNVIVNIGAYGFQGANIPGDQFSDDGNGYRYLTSSTSGGYMAAAVRVPGGAVIDLLEISACAGPTGGLTVALLDGRAFGLPVSLLGSITTTTQGNCFLAGTTVDHLYDHADGDPLYVVIHWEGPMDGTLKFNNAALHYHLSISPAPATATFADVPTSDPLFQYVEALAASGITAGCGNGNYCPNAPLTRGQMAVFLSKALGLEWPN
jgi:hypothetical protein